MQLDPKALEAARKAVGTTPGAWLWNDVEAAILSYLQHAGEGELSVRVKPLGWESYERDSNSVYAKTILGRYSAWAFADGTKDGYWKREGDSFGGKPCGGNLEAAKAAAQADYEARILSTLTTDTPVAGDGENYPVPDGWKLVPVEPTHEMELAALKASRSCTELPDGLKPLPHGYDGWSAAFVYRAMLAAAPPAQAGNDGWQDIATAPKDGTLIIVGRGEVRLSDLTSKAAIVTEASWSEENSSWIFGGLWEPHLVDQEHPPTHWRPLPASPQKGGE